MTLKWRGLISLAWIVLGLSTAVAVAQEKHPTSVLKPAAAMSDEALIRRQAAEFADAFARGDAKALAATWTENAEYQDDNVELRGRAAIEAAFGAFFTEHPGAKIEFRIDEIRFPARDLAIEEGLSIQTNPGAELPTSTRYLAIHVREDGSWKTAIGREWAANEDKLEDLTWIIGNWSAGGADVGTRVSYEWNQSRTAIDGTFQVVRDGQPVRAGRQHILRDPQSGQLCAWIFDDDGSRGETVWTRDGDRWLLEASGVSADGTQTSALNVLTRLSDNEYLFISTDRTAGDVPQPSTEPMKLTRATAAQ